MSLTADQNGVITGRFTVPANVPVGTKPVSFEGVGGSYGEATYTGSGQLNVTQRRRVTTITTRRWWASRDPLAQTFMLEQGRHIGGVDLWFKAKGTGSLRVQIRETTTGLPNQVILSDTRVTAGQLQLNQTTRISWNPIWLEAGREYALVILTNDAEHAVAVAEVGEYDSQRGWITAQTYTAGVLLSSANASTWTAHQKADLTFRLLAAKFDRPTQNNALGELDLSGVTDLLVLSDIERTATQTDARWQIGNQTLQEGAPLNLATALSGHQPLALNLTGTTASSPVIYPGAQLVAGTIRNTGTYITRAVPCGSNARVTVRVAAFVPGQASLQVELETESGWQTLSLTQGEPIGDGWEERTYSLSAVNSFEVRVRLTLTGSAKDRPKLKNLRVICTDD